MSRKIHQDALGNLWIVLNHNGIDYYHSQQQKFYHVTQTHKTGDINTGLTSNSVHNIEDYQGQLLICTANGLNIIDPQAAHQGNFNFTYLHSNEYDPTSLSSENLLTAFSEGTTLWVGTRYGGLICILLSLQNLSIINTGRSIRKA